MNETRKNSRRRGKYECLGYTKFLFLTTMFFIVFAANAAVNPLPLQKLLDRIAPGKCSKFEFQEIASSDKKDVYEVDAADGKIVIRGNNNNSLAAGLGYYLKYICRTTVSWDGADPVQLPAVLPLPPKKVRKTSDVKYRFFFNYCTFGYTMPFWKWKEWERCIDWMALNGINMPLAVTGMEKVLQEMWKEEGFSGDEVRGFFTGAAHLPWYHMNTISRWGGPLPQSYIEYGYNLQKKIVKRERELGMTPILPAFNGRVPVELKKKYPNKKISTLGTGWGMFDKKYFTYFLDPYDPLFAKLQKSFLEKMREYYGTDHLYGVDPFNEITPPSWELDYLAKTSKRIFETMSDVDKDAVWIQMGWLFYFDKHWTNDRVKALLTAVPYGKMIILDYFCETTEVWKEKEAFFGVPFIWCYLGNFGGKENYTGPLELIQNRFAATRQACGGKNLWGIGSTLEGFGVNQITFEFLFEQAWMHKKTDLKEWIHNYALRRTGGVYDKPVSEAWEIMLQKVYNKNSGTYSGGSILHTRPCLEGKKGFIWDYRNFSSEVLFKIWSLFMKASPETRKLDTFQYDLANVIRQYLGDLAPVVRLEMRDGYITKKPEVFENASKAFLGLLEDQEKIMATRPEFLFGKWIADARDIGSTDDDKDKLEQSARNLLTVWGKKSSPLMEYANRDWAGLTEGFYMKRWQIFSDKVLASLQKGEKVNFDTLNNELADWEWNWVTKNRDKYKSGTTGDTWEVAKELYKKYSALRWDKKKAITPKNIIFRWDPKNITSDYKHYSWDVSKYIDREGTCIITFVYKYGGQAVYMKDIRLKCNGIVIGEDLHKGIAGSYKEKNSFRFKIDEAVPAAKYLLELDMKANGKPPVDSHGDITMEIFNIQE